MREIRAIRKGVNRSSTAVGAVALPVVTIALVPQFLLLAAVAVGIALVIIAVGALRDRFSTPRRHAHPLGLDRAAIEHRRRMADMLGYDVYKR